MQDLGRVRASLLPSYKKMISSKLWGHFMVINVIKLVSTPPNAQSGSNPTNPCSNPPVVAHSSKTPTSTTHCAVPSPKTPNSSPKNNASGKTDKKCTPTTKDLWRDANTTNQIHTCSNCPKLDPNTKSPFSGTVWAEAPCWKVE
jgi:hypothetical protein